MASIHKTAQQFLNHLSKQLDSDDLRRLKFLLEADDFPTAQLENVESGQDLFKLLHTQKFISWQLVENLMKLIHRIDLQKGVEDFRREFSANDVPQIFENRRNEPTALRQFMYQIVDNLDPDTLERVKFCILSKSAREQMTSGFDVVDYFIRQKSISDVSEVLTKLEDVPDLYNICLRTDLKPIVNTKTYFRCGSVECSAKCPYKVKWRTLFGADNVPVFPKEELLIEKIKPDEECDGEELGRGSFGVICEGRFNNREVAIKTLYESTIVTKKDLKSIAYLRHPFLISIIRVVLTPRIRLYYCIKAKTDLSKYLKDCKTSGVDEAVKRIRILCQVSGALSFLHMPVNHFREAVVHMDVKPHNILLDAYENALLGDIDSAVEIPEEGTHRTFHGIETIGYADRYKNKDDHEKRPSDDIFSLGIVTLQTLKWQPALMQNNLEKQELFDSIAKLVKSTLGQRIDEINPEHILKSKEFLQEFNKDFFDHAIWKPDSKDHVEIGQMAVQCLLKPENRITAQKYTDILKKILENSNSKLWQSDKMDKRCIQCHFGEINGVLEVSSDGSCTPECIFYNNFCSDCHYFSFRNPLNCPLHNVVYPMIGSPKSFAILICGFDSDEYQYKAFKKDVRYVKRTITDPRIMNIRKENVLHVSKGQTSNMQNLQQQFQEKLDGQVEFLFVYYSGHAIKDDVIRLSEKQEDIICIKDLKILFESVKFERFLAVLDCCSAASIDIFPEQKTKLWKWIAILFSSDIRRSAKCDIEKGSLFTQYFLAGLQSAQKCLCQEKSNGCASKTGGCLGLENFRNEAAKTGLVKLQDLNDYIHSPGHEPNDQKPKIIICQKTDGSDTSGIVIAYYNKDPIAYNFLLIDKNKKFEMLMQLECIDYSSSTLQDAVLKKLYQEIRKLVPATESESYTASELKLESEEGKEITTVEQLRKLVNRNECIKVLIKQP